MDWKLIIVDDDCGTAASLVSYLKDGWAIVLATGFGGSEDDRGGVQYLLRKEKP